MAFIDALTVLAAKQAVTSTAAGTAVFDVTGVGSGTVPNMISGINGSTGAVVPIGFDIGAGDGFAIPELVWNVTTAFTSASSTTMQIALQAAPDNGSGSAGTYVTLVETELLTVAQLALNASGQFQVPPTPLNWVGEAMPRFYRVDFIVATSTFSAGNISAQIVLNPSQQTKIQNYPGNFVA